MGHPVFTVGSMPVYHSVLNSVLNVKALIGAFNQEKAQVGAFSQSPKHTTYFKSYYL